MFEHRDRPGQSVGETSGEPVAVVDVSTAEHSSVFPRSAKRHSAASHSLAVRNVRVWSPASSPATADVLPSSDPGEKDAVLLNVGARVNADTYDEHEGHRQPHVDIAVTHLRAGVHADSMERIARFCVTCVKHVQAPSSSLNPGDSSAVMNHAMTDTKVEACQPGVLAVNIADASVFVPSPRRGDVMHGYSDGRGLLLALGPTNLRTRLPLASAVSTGDHPPACLTGFSVQSVRLAPTEPEEYEWIVALQPRRSYEAMNRRPMIHADPINVPALLSVGAVRGVEKQSSSEALSLSVDVPLVSCTFTPTSAGLVLDAARAFSSFGDKIGDDAKETVLATKETLHGSKKFTVRRRDPTGPSTSRSIESRLSSSHRTSERVGSGTTAMRSPRFSPPRV